MDAVFLAVAFFFGLVAQQFRLPPLVGFLVSGFAKAGPHRLHSAALLGHEKLETTAIYTQDRMEQSKVGRGKTHPAERSIKF